jgi:signal transduction histidine kinase
MPKSLIGQIALVMAAALLIAQAINFSLIFTERMRFSRAQAEGPPVSRFILHVQRIAGATPPRTAELLREPRRGRYSIDPRSLIAGPGDSALTDRLREGASTNGLALRDARAAFVDPAAAEGMGDQHLPGKVGRGDRHARHMRLMLLSVQLQDGRWINARIVVPRPQPWLVLRPLLATLLTYLIILAAMVWIAARLTRPLRDLTEAADRLQGGGETPQVTPRGPADLRRAILAFNAMSARVSAMLDEKDRMLGAIGHDLRTPLASLRIRAEGVEPAEERQPMIATIEEMTAMLDDTLALARSGRTVEEPRVVDLVSLADAVVEEFRALGKDVTMETEGRHSALIQPSLIRRAVRNLIENGVKYGAKARVAVRERGDQLAIEVADDGPGIPQDEMERVMEPFYRIERSRSRETGGTGLGLTLARAAAIAHGGRLELENGTEGGLVARMLLPKDADKA